MARFQVKVLTTFFEGTLESYSQIFFSKHKLFALILLAVSFFDWIAGLSGLISVITANLAAQIIGFNNYKTSQGYYGFNSLLVGLGVGVYYQPGFAFFFILIFASLLTFFITIWLEGFFGKYGLPYLSWPFLFGIWMVSLASRQFSALEISNRGVFMINDMYFFGGMPLVNLYHWFGDLPLSDAIIIYFRSLGAIYFQNHLLAGVLIAIGLLIYSRIAFLLSLTGFFAAYFYYLFIGANLGELNYSYIGFNYILTAIAIGGLFLVPSRYSFLWVLLFIPILSFIITSTSSFFASLRLSIFSLAFNIVTLLFIYVLKFRERKLTKPELVSYQQFSPEKNLYSHVNFKERFGQTFHVPLILPFFGEWTVSQGHNGKHTHRDEWRHAWDFEIIDENGKKFNDTGFVPEDYYCYNKPVIAPADGIVQEIEDGIGDNKIGQVNMEKNWGNTIVLKHREHVYTKLSHLKKGTFTVKPGDHVKCGEVIANCGNSGRSPLPHVHFQIQATPFIGSKTIDYQIAKYLSKDNKGIRLKTFDKPCDGETVMNITRNDSLFRTYNFIPGQTVLFEVKTDAENKDHVEWDVKTDQMGNSYLECRKSGSRAWFKNDGTLFTFTHFEGSNNSFLYYFYLGSYKVTLGFYKNLVCKDTYPLAAIKSNILLFFHDFIAPFHFMMKADYEMHYIKMDDDLSSNTIIMRSIAMIKVAGKIMRRIDFELVVEGSRISSLHIKGKKLNIQAKEISS